MSTLWTKVAGKRDAMSFAAISHFRSKLVLRYDPSWPKLRLVRFMWERGNVGDGQGTSNKLAIALRPRLFNAERSMDGWRLTVLGIEVHRQVSWGGRFA